MLSIRRGIGSNGGPQSAGALSIGVAALIVLFGTAATWVARIGVDHGAPTPVYQLRMGTPTAPASDAHENKQEAVTLAAQLDATGQPTLLVTTPALWDGQPVTEVRVSTDGLESAAAGHLPEGWSAQTVGGALAFTGPALTDPSAHFRIDLGSAATTEALNVFASAAGMTVYDRTTDVAQLAQMQVIDVLANALHFPWQVTPGEMVTFQAVANSPIVPGGSWSIAGSAPQVVQGAAGQPLSYQWRVPTTLTPASAVSVTWTNPFGQVAVNVPTANVGVVTPPAAAAQAPPRLIDCTPRGFAGRVVCLCGWFPTAAERDGFTLDGQPLSVVAASSTTVLVRLPSDAQPGPRTIAADAGRGFDASQTISIVILAARGSVDQNRLRLGQSTPLRLEVLGTTDQLDIVLTNYTPGIVQVTGGIVQVVRTSGGTPNVAQRQVQGITPGNFDIGYQLAEDPCPCVDPPGTVVAGTPTPPGDTPPPGTGLPPVPPAGPPPPGGGTTTGPPPGDSTTTGPPLPPITGPPPVPPGNPPAFPPPNDETDDDTCCGFRPDGTITFPKITDPLVPAPVRMAPRDPAYGATQVLLHSGAYVHNEVDLEVQAVGFPFRLARRYVGDVETVEGGVLGHRWDFALNKRLVPQAARELGTNMLLERPLIETPQVWYYDGHGDAALRDGIESEWRDVLNFGVRTPIRAFVTTYEQLPGDFFEIQRYVLEDPADHPFGRHPAVDIERGEAIFFVLRERNGLRYIFNCRGQLIHTLHRNDMLSLAGRGAGLAQDSVRMTFEYDGPLNPLTQNPMLSRIRDASGHVFTVDTRDIGQASLDTNYQGRVRSELIPIPRVSEIRGVGRTISFEYDTNANGGPTLRSVIDSVGAQTRTTRYGYDSERRLTTVVTPKQMASEQKPYLTNRYGAAGKVVEQVVGHPDSSNAIRTYISYSGQSTTTRDARGNETRYDWRTVAGHPVVQAATLTPADASEGGPWSTRFEHNGHTQVVRITEPRGNVTELAYDGQDDPVTEGWIRNKSSAVTYARDLSAGNLISVTQRPGTAGASGVVQTTLAYEPLYNQIAEEVDARGNRTTYRYVYQQPGDFGNYVGRKVPDITRPDGSRVAVPEFEREFNVRGQLVREHMDGERERTYEFDSRGYLVRETFPEFAEKTYQRDIAGLVLAEGGSFGETRFLRGPFGEVTETIEDPSGFANRTQFTYDRDGGLIERRRELKDNFTAPVGGGGPARVPDQWVTERFTLDILGRATKEERGSGADWLEQSHQYDDRGLRSWSGRPGVNGNFIETSYAYDARGLIKEVRQGLGTSEELVESTTHDANGNVISRMSRSERDPAGLSAGPDRDWSYEYDGVDRLVAVTDPLGARTEYTLDAAGNVTEERVVENQGGIELRRVRRSYDELGSPITEETAVLNAEGHVATSEVYLDRFLARVRTVGPAGGEARYRYDAAGRVIEVVSPSGDTLRSVYDVAGNRVQVSRTEVGNRMDSLGGLQPTYDRRSVEYAYDALGRVVRESGEVTTTRYFHDSFSNPRGVLLADGASDSIRYDGLGRKVLHAVGARRLITTFGPDGLPSSRTDGAHQTRWTWDVHGRLKSEQASGAGTRSIRRDAHGNPLEVTDANGTVVTTTFNAVGLPLRRSVAKAGRSLTVHGMPFPYVQGPAQIDYEYDVLGQLTFAGTDWDGDVQSGAWDGASTRLSYDGLGRVEFEDQDVPGSTYRVRRAYAANHRTVSTTYPSQAGALTVHHRLDALGRVTEVSTDTVMVGTVAHYSYQGPSRISGRWYANLVTTQYGVDPQAGTVDIDVQSPLRYGASGPVWSGQLTSGRYGVASIREQRPAEGNAPSVDMSTTFSYSTSGRRTRASTALVTRSQQGSIQAHTVSTTMSGYQNGQLVAASETLIDEVANVVQFARSDRFVNDSLGRRSSMSTVIGSNFRSPVTPWDAVRQVDSAAGQASSQLTGGKNFLYDGNGNLISDGELVYAYDHEGRLTRVMEVRPGGGESILFTYDALGRRVRADPLPGGGAVGLVNWGTWDREPVDFVYDGRQTIAEIDRGPVAATGAPVRRRYILGARPGERIRAEYWDGSGGLQSFYLHEGMQGEVALLTDSAGYARDMVSTGPTAGTGYAIPDEMRFVQGTNARAPYLSWTTRVDGFAGTRYDELEGGAHIDYRPIRALADSAGMQAMRQSVSSAQTTGALTLGALAALPLSAWGTGVLATSGAGAFTWSGFLTPVVLTSSFNAMGGAAAAWFSGDDSYGLREYLSDAGEGAILGLAGGKAAAAGFKLPTAIGLEAAFAMNLRTATGLYEGLTPIEATNNALQETGLEVATMGVMLGTGKAIAGVISEIQSRALAEGVAATTRRVRPGSPTLTFEYGVLKDMNDYKSFVPKALAVPDAKSMEMAVLGLLERGTAMSAVAARGVRSGSIKVRIADMDPGYAGYFFPKSRNTIYVNYKSLMAGGRVNPMPAALTVVHEFTHAAGGGELAAWVAELQFASVLVARSAGRAALQGAVNVPWLSPMKNSALRAYLKGRGGQFPDLLGGISRTYAQTGQRLSMHRGIQPFQVVNQMGGFSRMLGVDHKWAMGWMQVLDAGRLPGHYE